MIRLINHRAWLFCILYGTLLLALAFPSLQQLAATQAPWMNAPLAFLKAEPRVAAIILSVIGCAFLFKPIWRSAWRLPIIGRFFSEAIFPDLNGEWEIEIRSNWPIIDSMRRRAEESTRAPVTANANGSSLSTVRLKGVVSQGWLGANLEIRPVEATPLRVSRTLSFDFLRATDDAPKRVAWIFRQENKEVGPTDESNFLGSALLEVDSDMHLIGTYWTNRSWRKGLNVAGEIEMWRKG